ncbi:DUF4349 domain-containing protein [Evansella clarkii]|jgi:hypothetical protein|uniref:DUF4349 domain-containing protein n=1 Tax=Evansella clarkii TaxID=79879 RepID=UPI000996C256|nr:DUF4349 domain-containing protein [Evansella clarkii]
MEIKPRFFIRIILALIFFILFTGCSNNDSAQENTAVYNDADNSGYTEMEEEAYETSEDVDNYEEPELRESAGVETQHRMVIYNADLSIEVNDYNSAYNDIQNKTVSAGGFIVESSQHQNDGGALSGYITVRLPQEHFHSFINDLESGSSTVLEKYVHGNDVTEEYVDLESRLRSQEAVEERLLSFMEQAENTEDLLNISQDLADVQEEIETITGRMNYLENHVAYSTVSIHIRERYGSASTLQNTDDLNTWERAQSLFTDTLNFIITFFSGAAVLIIGLSPVLLPLIIAAVLIFFLYKRKNRRKEKKPENPSE